MKKMFLCFALIPLLVACDSQQVVDSEGTESTTINANETAVAKGDGDSAVEAAEAEPVKTAGEQITELTGAFKSKMDAFEKAMNEASDDNERRKLFQEMYPNPQEYAPKLLELARENGDDPKAVDAWTFVASYTRPGSSDNKEAMDVLFEKYADTEGIADICFNMMYSRDSDAADKLQDLVDNNPHDKVKAMASFVLASLLKNKSESDDSIGEDQYLPLFKSVVENYADAEFRGRNLADMAAGEIFAVENLAIGKEAPDIEGEDLDGVAFKLSDYRGKVIMLDFWGDW